MAFLRQASSSWGLASPSSRLSGACCSPSEVARRAELQGLIGYLYIRWCFHIPLSCFHGARCAPGKAGITTWPCSLMAAWFLIGETHRGQQWTPALTLPQVRYGLSVLLLEAFCTLSIASICRHVQRQLRFCRKFCSGGHEGAVAPVCGGIRRP